MQEFCLLEMHAYCYGYFLNFPNHSLLFDPGHWLLNRSEHFQDLTVVPREIQFTFRVKTSQAPHKIPVT